MDTQPTEEKEGNLPAWNAKFQSDETDAWEVVQYYTNLRRMKAMFITFLRFLRDYESHYNKELNQHELQTVLNSLIRGDAQKTVPRESFVSSEAKETPIANIPKKDKLAVKFS